jgi:D-alanyl-D-alanine carboxypeptidase
MAASLVGAAFAPTFARAQVSASVLDDDLAAILKSSGAPALAAIVFTPDAVLYQGAAGRRRADKPDLVTKDDQWHLGSNTKAMTATLYARFVEQGRAKWGAKVPELFPGVPFDPSWKDITVEDLMHHRSGMKVGPKFTLDPKFPIGVAVLGDDLAAARERAEFARLVLAVKQEGTYGTFEYSNGNYMLVGAALERIAGVPWETIIQRELFQPLGMTSAGFGAPRGAQPWGHREGKAIDPTGLSDNPPVLGPAGTVHAALQDYIKFTRLFLTDGGGLLTPDSVRRILTPGPGEGMPYGLGWAAMPGFPWAAGPLVTHDGSNTFWYVTARLSPARKLGIVAASNDGVAGAKAASELAVKLMERYPAA